MLNAIKKCIETLYPQLTHNLIYPRLGVVTSIPDPNRSAVVASDYRPFLACDIQLIDDHLQLMSDADAILKKVPICITSSTQVAQLKLGDTILLQFANGLVSQPIITQVLPKQTFLKPTDNASYQNDNGNEIRHTPQGVFQKNQGGHHIASTHIKTTARCQTENACEYAINAKASLNLKAIGTLHLKAFGIVKVDSGGALRLLSKDNLSLVSGREIRLASNETISMICVSDIIEKTEKIKTSIAKQKQIIQSPKLHIGSESVNILKELETLTALVSELANNISNHSHPGHNAPPTTASLFLSVKTRANAIKEKFTSFI